MITNLRLENFKGHRQLRLNFDDAGERRPARPITMLVGPNGGGKTTVLQAIHFAMLSVRDTPTADMVGELNPDVLLSKERGGMFEVELNLTIDNQPCSVLVQPEEAFFDVSGGKITRRLNQPNAPVPNLLKRVNTRLFRLDARAIAAASYSEQEIPALSPRGEFTVNVLAYLKLADDEVFGAIEEDLRRLVPTIRRLRIQPKRVLKAFGAHREWINGHQIVADVSGAPDTTADGLSDGTLLILAVLTALHTAGKHTVLLLDDIEHALHPVAQMELVQTIKRLVEAKSGLQVIATTHSPYVLDEVDVDQTLVFFPRDDGTICVRSLAEHPDAAKAIGTLSAGQIWSLSPEDWVEERGE